ncbi:hypothetical protein CAPTEDRAFT_189742, partial [Capitella teleta]
MPPDPPRFAVRHRRLPHMLENKGFHFGLIPDEDAFIYDPLYAPSHNKFLETRLKFKIIDANEEGKRQVNSSTVFFMPHCGKPLYNNLLWRNWNIDSLSDMIIIGNSFNYMND